MAFSRQRSVVQCLFRLVLTTKRTDVKKTGFKFFSSKHFKLCFVVYFSLLFFLYLLLKQSKMNGQEQANIFSTFKPAKLTFTPNDISSWFVQLESNMAMRSLNSQNNTFHFCRGNLLCHIIPEIMDLAENPPVSNAYDILKEGILARVALSERRKI